MPNPWLLLGLLVAWAGSMAGAYRFGRGVEQGAQAREDMAVIATRAAAADAAASAIARIEVQRVEITQPIVREIRTHTVYADCRHTPDGLRGVNAALTGRADPPSRGQLPAAAPAR